MLLIEATIGNFIKFVNLWNSEYSFNMIFRGHHGSQTAWTVGNVLISGIEIAPNRILCEFDNFDLQGFDTEARRVTGRLKGLLSSSFGVDDTLNGSAVYGIMERQAKRTWRVFPAVFADTLLDTETEAEYKAIMKEKNPGITEDEVDKAWQDFCQLVEQQKSKREDQERRLGMTAEDAAAAWLKNLTETEAGKQESEEKGLSNLPKLLLVTATKVESKAIIDVFQKTTGQVVQPKEIDDRIYHDLGTVNGRKVFMVQSEMGSGGLGASLQTIQRGIATLLPTKVVMVGIAFGVKEDEQAIGDILVSRQLMLYELQRLGTQKGKPKLIPRGDRPRASTSLISLFRSAELYWDESIAKVHFGLILSGEKLVDNIDFREELRVFEPEAIGGEMEGAGLYVACQDAKVDWILIKAICDWADGYKGTEKMERQQLAAHNAASFVLHAIKYLSTEVNRSQELTTPLAQNKYPILTLKLIDNMGQHSNEIAFIQTANRQDFQFGLALINSAKGSNPAEKIDIRIECSWDGNVISSAPSFKTDLHQRTTPNWTTTRQLIQQGAKQPYPAVLAYHGDGKDRCAYGHPLEWHRFNIITNEKMTGKFILEYTISSANPKSESTGRLAILIRQNREHDIRLDL